MYHSSEPWGPSPHWHHQDFLLRVTVAQPGVRDQAPRPKSVQGQDSPRSKLGVRGELCMLGQQVFQETTSPGIATWVSYTEPGNHNQDPKSTATWMHSSIPKPENKASSGQQRPEWELTWWYPVLLAPPAFHHVSCSPPPSLLLAELSTAGSKCCFTSIQTTRG